MYLWILVLRRIEIFVPFNSEKGSESNRIISPTRQNNELRR